MINSDDIDDLDEFNDGRVKFYYSRENRLNKASKAVRDLNTLPPKKPHFFRSLTATRPLRFLFISIITLYVMVFLLSRLLPAGNTQVLENNTITVSVIASGENSYITVNKTAKTALAYTGEVGLAFFLPDEDNPRYVKHIYFGPDNEEEFRFIVPFTGKKILAFLEAGSGRAAFTITP